jgi:hypothetical protein
MVAWTTSGEIDSTVASPSVVLNAGCRPLPHMSPPTRSPDRKPLIGPDAGQLTQVSR